MAPLIHILILQFKADIGSEVVQKAIFGLLALKDTCLHPETQQAYIKNITGGKGTSPPGAGSQDPNQYAFVIEFEDAADFDYYINKDATHKAYAESIAALMEKATVVDYTAGVF